MAKKILKAKVAQIIGISDDEPDSPEVVKVTVSDDEQSTPEVVKGIGVKDYEQRSPVGVEGLWVSDDEPSTPEVEVGASDDESITKELEEEEEEEETVSSDSELSTKDETSDDGSKFKKNRRKKPTREVIPRRSKSLYKRASASTKEAPVGSIVDSDIEEVECEEQKTANKKPTFATKKRKASQVNYLPRTNNAPSYEATWSELDKQRLLIALQRYGILEIDQLLKAVPGKNEAEIRKFISLKWKMARGELRSHMKEVRKLKGDKSNYLGPVDNWLEVLNRFFPNFDHYKNNPIAHAVLLIWKFEKHPDPSECGGVDFKALYEYLYYVMCGYPPKHLNQPTAAYLADTLKNFASQIKTGDWAEEMKFLDQPLKINCQEPPTKTMEDVLKALSFTKEQCLDELAKLPGLNPFSIPRELLLKKVPACCDEANSSTPTSTTPRTATEKDLSKPGTSKDS